MTNYRAPAFNPTTKRVEWPSGCHSPNSCDRHQQCMYTNCWYENQDIKPAIAAAIRATKSEAAGTGGGE